MNDKHQDQPDAPMAPLPEPDAFERRWISLLDADAPDKADDDAEAFVAGVMDRYDAMRHPASRSDHAVAGRIGHSALPYAAAAAVLLAAFIGGYALLTGNPPGTAPTDQLAAPGPTTPNDANTQENNAPPQPDAASRVVSGEPAKVELGRLIGQTQALATRPDPDLIKTLNQTRQMLDLGELIEVVNRPLPDLRELLAPLKQEDPQSRA